MLSSLEKQYLERIAFTAVAYRRGWSLAKIARHLGTTWYFANRYLEASKRIG